MKTLTIHTANQFPLLETAGAKISVFNILDRQDIKLGDIIEVDIM